MVKTNVMKNIILPVTTVLAIAICCNNPDKKENDMTTHNDSAVHFKSGYSKVNGINMYYEIHGEGHPLVLVHGGGSTIQSSFGKLIPQLSKSRQIIAMELQAHGRTGDRDAPESFEQDADDVVTLIRNLGLTKVDILGYSNGGNTAMQAAIRHPEAVNKLIVTSSFYKRGGLPPGFFEMMGNATLKDMPETLKKAFFDVNSDSNQLQVMFNKDRERMLHFKDWPDDMLRSIKAPTLFISGDQDVASVNHTAAMAFLVSGSRIMIFPCGHGSFIGVAESPEPGSNIFETTVAVIDNFLGH
jgi:pimeloyl-ACP methyl ester carboxylesterase